MKTYQDQAKEVEQLAKRIILKAKNFADRSHSESPYFGDLLHIIEELKEVDYFMNDKYLK